MMAANREVPRVHMVPDAVNDEIREGLKRCAGSQHQREHPMRPRVREASATLGHGRHWWQLYVEHAAGVRGAKLSPTPRRG